MITGDAFIDYASKLAARNAATEAEQRSAVSRAYYGAYHLAKSFLERLGFTIQERNHDFVKNCFVSSGQKLAKQVGIRLGDLRTQRNRADYDLKASFPLDGGDPQTFLRLWVESAKEVESLLSQCAEDSVRSLVKAEVEQFLNRQRRVRGTSGPDPSVN